MVGSSVANGLIGDERIAARQRVEQRRLADVGVADQRDERFAVRAPLRRARAAGARLRAAGRATLTRCWMRRRSTSSFVSPGPRVPMPPPRRESSAPTPIRFDWR